MHRRLNTALIRIHNVYRDNTDLIRIRKEQNRENKGSNLRAGSSPPAAGCNNVPSACLLYTSGSISTMGSMTGANAEAALLSYMGYAGMDGEDIPHYSGVEIGGGRIMGTETTTDYPNGIAFGMYSTEQYTACLLYTSRCV